jgi:hypothetical protein
MLFVLICSLQLHRLLLKPSLLHFLLIMKFTSTVGALALAASADAHYVFPSLIVSGAITTAWNYVRQYPTYYTNNPVTTVSTDDIRCNVGGDSTFAPATMSVAAGSTIGMTSSPNIYHNGVGLAYMAKVPSGKTAATWELVYFSIEMLFPFYTRPRARDCVMSCYANGLVPVCAHILALETARNSEFPLK